MRRVSEIRAAGRKSFKGFLSVRNLLQCFFSSFLRSLKKLIASEVVLKTDLVPFGAPAELTAAMGFNLVFVCS